MQDKNSAQNQPKTHCICEQVKSQVTAGIQDLMLEVDVRVKASEVVRVNLPLHQLKAIQRGKNIKIGEFSIKK